MCRRTRRDALSARDTHFCQVTAKSGHVDVSATGFVTARRCMQLVDADRLLYAREQRTYRLILSSLAPLECSAKNSVVMLMPATPLRLPADVVRLVAIACEQACDGLSWCATCRAFHEARPPVRSLLIHDAWRETWYEIGECAGSPQHRLESAPVDVCLRQFESLGYGAEEGDPAPALETSVLPEDIRVPRLCEQREQLDGLCVSLRIGR